MKKVGILGLGIIVLLGCATTKSGDMATGPESQAGFLKGYYDKLAPGPEDGAKLRWLKPGADWKNYDKVMLDSVVFFFDDASEYKGIEPNELKALADSFNQAFVEALQKDYPIVKEPGPDVMRIRFAITDLDQSNPGISAVTTVVPIGIGVSVLKKGATGSWAGSGAAAAEAMVLDSLTNEVIAVVKDERAAGFTERYSKWGSAEEAFKFWAKRVKKYLDTVHRK